MIKSDRPYCDGCHQELKAWTEEEALNSISGGGWSDWKTAEKHYCEECYEAICDKIGFPPCGICETHPCEKGRDCWANPPLDLFPYETFFGETLKENPNDEVFQVKPTDDLPRRKQKMQMDALNKYQQILPAFTTETKP